MDLQTHTVVRKLPAKISSKTFVLQIPNGKQLLFDTLIPPALISRAHSVKTLLEFPTTFFRILRKSLSVVVHFYLFSEMIMPRKMVLRYAIIFTSPIWRKVISPLSSTLLDQSSKDIKNGIWGRGKEGRYSISSMCFPRLSGGNCRTRLKGDGTGMY